MTSRVYQPAKKLRAVIAKVMAIKPAPKRHTFDFEFNGTETTKTLKAGWMPKAVYLSGSREREGAGNDYLLSFDGFLWTVTWSTAPTGTDWAYIDAELVQ